MQAIHRLIIVTGLSGAGKTVVLDTLEDAGYHCIDNLPLPMFPNLIEHIRLQTQHMPDSIAIGIDARTSGELSKLPEILSTVEQRDMSVELIFIGADTPTLIKRFNETRRKHPLASDKLPLADAIAQEKTLLSPLREEATLYIDTSHTGFHELSQLIKERIVQSASENFSLQFSSFGYKYGIPEDANFVFDVRCLANPYWQPDLRPLTGLNTEVAHFLREQAAVRYLLSNLKQMLDDWLPQFSVAAKRYTHIAIGCTGGKHRSVFMVEELAAYFSTQAYHVLIRHRDIGQ